MEGNEMFLFLFVFVCQGVLGGQIKFFLCIRMRDGWLVLAVSGVNDCFLGRFWVFGLLVGSLRRVGCG